MNDRNDIQESLDANPIAQVLEGFLGTIKIERESQAQKEVMALIETSEKCLNAYTGLRQAVAELDPDRFGLYARMDATINGHQHELAEIELTEVFEKTFAAKQGDKQTLETKKQEFRKIRGLLVFIFTQASFLESQLENIIVKHEGAACSADKTRTILRTVAQSIFHGKKIQWNYQGEYTYHLPKKVFVEHEEIMEFVQSVYQMYYGKHEKFAEIVLKYSLPASQD